MLHHFFFKVPSSRASTRDPGLASKSLYKGLVFCVLTLFSFGLSTPIAQAQLFADVSLELSPRYPKVGDTVTARLVSSEVNLDFQSISWYINGVRGLSGTAQYSQIFTIEPGVKSYTIRAVIGNAVTPLVRETTITPGEVMLLWEAVDSYTPHWYRGKALMSAEGVVRITAIPVGSNTPDNLFYVWKQGTNALGDQSGYGRNTLVLRNNILLDSLDVTVTVSSANGDYQSEGSISIPRSEPDVRLWSPRVGFASTYEQGGVLRLFGADATVEALPYGLSSRNGSSNLSFAWNLNQIPYIPGEDELDSSIFIANSPNPITVDLQVQGINTLLDSVEVKKQLRFE